ncbi:MAG: HD domain-containing protein [Clostridia bacterium]|nr:HD domain-containing protein [Clostridia bacterium]
MSKKINSDILDRAIAFATAAHKDVPRRGKKYPYIVHPMEAVSIVSTLTDDQELLAAAALHDVVEDTDFTVEDIRREFGDRVAMLVDAESDTVYEGMSEEESWKMRKIEAIEHLKHASLDIKMVAIGDKLSNIRAIERDFLEQGDDFWNLFHVKDVESHRWHYEGLRDALSELEGTDAYKEFSHRVDKVFNKACKNFHYEFQGRLVKLYGHVNDNIQEVLDQMDISEPYTLDFARAGEIKFSAQRALVGALDKGQTISIVNANAEVFDRISTSGLANKMEILKKPSYFAETKDAEPFGGGSFADSYYTKDGEGMYKLYHENFPLEKVYDEAILAEKVFHDGVNTPMVGDIIHSGDRYGIVFERLKGKESYARLMSWDESKTESLSRDFAREAKKLHSIKVDTGKYNSYKELVMEKMESIPDFTEEEKQKMQAILDRVEDTDTLLHGDLHTGNLITANDQKMWIDLGDVCYGNPIFDFLIMYYVGYTSADGMIPEVFHMSREQFLESYEYILMEYFQLKNKEELEAKKKEIEGVAVTKLLRIPSVDENVIKAIKAVINSL